MSEERKQEEIKNEPLAESNLDEVVGGTPNTTNTTTTTTSSGHGTIQDIHITKLVDKASTTL